jgi:pimeloyl-ACP methyl ester carboxylesterase
MAGSRMHDSQSSSDGCSPKESVKESVGLKQQDCHSTAPFPQDAWGALVRTQTADGIRLDGFFQPAEGDDQRAVLVCVHGAASNFYAGGLWDELVPAVRRAGYAVLRVNTRGHDGHFTTRSAQGTVRLGAAYERVSDCTEDLRAWVDWVGTRGFDRAILLGHSLGGIKVLYSQAHAPHPLVAGVLALSAPRLSCSLYGTTAPAFPALLDRARQLCRDGQGNSVFESTFPFPMLITGESFLDKYGGERYNILTFLDRIQVPIAFLYGELELQGNPSFQGLPEAVAECTHSRLAKITIIPGADHFYSGCAEALAQAVLTDLTWIESR